MPIPSASEFIYNAFMGSNRLRVLEQTEEEEPLPLPIAVTFAHLAPVALGVAAGTVLGIGIFLATIILVIRGGAVVGPNLALLAQYFVGYTVTWGGAFLGLAYGFLVGFLAGYSFATIRNGIVRSYLFLLRRRQEEDQISNELP